MGAKYAEKRTEWLPGPGQYNVAKTHNDQPMISFAKSTRDQ